MGGCSAPNCSGNTNKGNKLYRYPADPDRRRIWIINTRRTNWTPSRGALLCEKHFERSQFELKRADGHIKLKPNAIPTIFNHYEDSELPEGESEILITVLPPKLPEVPQVSDEEFARMRVQGEHNYFNHKTALGPDSALTEVLGEMQSEMNGLSDAEDATPCEEGSCTSGAMLKFNRNCEKCHEKKLEIRRLRRQVQMLNQQIENIEKNLSSFLNKDQMDALKYPLPGRARALNWSDDGVLSALKLRCAVGAEGYEYLRQAAFPLPSARTLYMRTMHGDGLGNDAQSMIEQCKSEKKIRREVNHRRELRKLGRPAFGECRHCGRRFGRGRPKRKRKPKSDGVATGDSQEDVMPMEGLDPVLDEEHPNDRYCREQTVAKKPRKRTIKSQPKLPDMMEDFTIASSQPFPHKMQGAEDVNRYNRPRKRPYIHQHHIPDQHEPPPVVRIDQQHMLAATPVPLIYTTHPQEMVQGYPVISGT